VTNLTQSDAEYQSLKKQASDNEAFAQKQRESFAELGLTEAEVERAMQPTLSFHAQVIEEIERYEHVSNNTVK